MKKKFMVVLVVMLVCSLVFGLAGCAGNSDNSTESKDSSEAPASSEADTPSSEDAGSAEADAGASQEAPAGGGGDNVVAGPEFIVAWIHGNAGYESAAQTRAAVMDYIAEHDIQWTIEETDCENDAAKLTSAIEDAVTKKVNVIITDFADLKSAANAIQGANAANIPIYSIDTGSYVPGTVAEVTTNNAENAAKEAMYMVNKLGGEGKVIFIDLDAHAGVAMRVKIFQAVIGQFPGIEVLEYYNCDPTKYVEDATGAMEQFISKYGLDGIDAVMCGWDEGAMGVSNAIIAAGGSREDIIVCGYDGHRDVVVDAMADPAYPTMATIAQNFPAYGTIVFDLVQRIEINGEDPASILKGKNTIYVRASLVADSNIDQVPPDGSTANTPDADYGDYSNVTDYVFSWQ